MIVEQDENMQMELLTPLTANFMPETSYWNELDEDDEASITGNEDFRYADLKDRLPKHAE